MNRFKRTLMIMTSTLLLALPVAPCRAADSAFSNSGSLVDTPAEGALLVFNSQAATPFATHSGSAAADLSTSGDFALTSSAKSLFVVENGTVKISLPTITPEFYGNNGKGIGGVMVKASLISGSF